MEEMKNKESSEEVIMLGGSATETTVTEIASEIETPVASEEIISLSESSEEEKNSIDEAKSELQNNENLQQVLAEVTNLSNKIEQMNQLFLQKIAHTTHEEKIVDQMHAELQKYKEDMYSQLVRPILLDIIDIRNSIIRMSASFAAKAEGEQSVPLKTFSDYAYDVQDILEKNNITIYDSKEGDSFNPTKQRAIKKITTPVEALHGKVAESLSSGYEYLGKPISPEKVVVYFYQKPEVKEGENE